jgi:hypothetical protein
MMASKSATIPTGAQPICDSHHSAHSGKLILAPLEPAQIAEIGETLAKHAVKIVKICPVRFSLHVADESITLTVVPYLDVINLKHRMLD